MITFPTEHLKYFLWHLIYRQHCVQRNAPIFNLLRPVLRFWGEVWHRGGAAASVPNFTPIRGKW